MDDMGNNAADMNYYDLLVELYQEEIENCEVSLVSAGLGGGLNNSSQQRCNEV